MIRVVVTRLYPFDYYWVRLDLTPVPEVSKAFSLENHCLGDLYAVMDDFGDLITVNPWHNVWHYIQRHDH